LLKYRGGVVRRHDALIPLTHDHHHALHNLRLLRRASDEDDAGRLDAARTFAAFFREHSVLHFREEEEEIFPLVISHPEAPTDGVVRVLVEHVRLHAMVKALEAQVARGSVEAVLMQELADLLRGHIRFEEDDLFPAIERLVGEELGAVSLAERDRT
jgi:hemerythrin-like domain-containing protein